MELRQLEHFLAVVEEGSFSSAAARLYMVQSSLSASVLALERELEANLFVRGRRGVELTDAGRALREPARATLESVGHARDAVSNVTGLLRGSVRIATPVLPPHFDIAPTIRRFQDRYPGVDVYLSIKSPQDVVDLVTDGRVDFGISPQRPGMGSPLCFDPLIRSPLVILCPTGHRLAGSRDLHLKDVINDSLIDLPKGWWSRTVFDRLLDNEKLQRRPRFEVNNWFSVLSLVNRGLGISYGPRIGVDQELFRRIEPATFAKAPHLELGVVTRNPAQTGPAGRALLTAYRQQCREGVLL